MDYVKLNVGMFGVNCYILYENSFGLIIDPGAEAERIINEVSRKNINITGILLTHGHFDHVGAVKALKENFKVPVYMSLADNYMTEDPSQNLNFGTGGFDGFRGDVFVKDGMEITSGSMTVKVFSTPGHTQGSVSYLCGKFMFSGDTLFAGTVGRCDFPGGDYDQLMDSVKRVYLTLDNDTVILPGHNEITDIKTEKSENPYILRL